jgi:N-acetyl-anhydromuramyl-L-alanine amidase AmpD
MKMIPGYPGHTSGSQSSVSRIVIHGTVSPCVKGGAESVAKYFQSSGAGGSAHYVVDPSEVVQCYSEKTICWHAPPNANSIGVELCDPQTGASSRWADANHEAMLVRAAALVREIAARWNVPLVRLSVADLKAGRRGICGHVDVSQAFHQTDHTDPGSGFPWAHFMDLVTRGTVQEEDPMAGMTKQDIYDAVWKTDQIAGPADAADHKTNATWQPQSILKDVQVRVRSLTTTVAALTATVKTLADQLGKDVDTAQVVAAVEDAIAKATVKVDVSVTGDGPAA